ncbi:hypothetical protein ES702_06891 [subsurface metagenome]
MIDHIFADIMKEARSRKGKDLETNIYKVLLELGIRFSAAMEGIRQDERRKEKDEG